MPIKTLTQEQMASIEANNKLLKVFSGYIANLEQLNPGVELDVVLLLGAFTVGCIAVNTANESIQLQVRQEIEELRLLGYTVSKEQQEQGQEQGEVQP